MIHVDNQQEVSLHIIQLHYKIINWLWKLKYSSLENLHKFKYLHLLNVWNTIKFITVVKAVLCLIWCLDFQYTNIGYYHTDNFYFYDAKMSVF